MMVETLKLELPLLLPEVADERDQCVERLKERLVSLRGVANAHIDHKEDQVVLCLHYDPKLVSLEQVDRLARQAGVEVTRRYRHESLPIRGMDCGDCAASIEHVLGRLDGVVNASVSYAAERLFIEYDSTVIGHKNIVQRVRWMGYKIEEAPPATRLGENQELIRSLTSGFFLAVGYFGERLLVLPYPAAIACYVLAYLTGGYNASRHGLKAALHLRFDIDFLMVVAAVGAAVLGQWPEGALLLFLFSLGHALEHYATDRARHAIEALGQLSPRTARVRRDGQESELSVDEIERGDVVIVRPGERIPLDGKVQEGRSAVDQSPITGESIPLEKDVEDEVFAGTVNGDGTLEIEVTKLARDTTLARVVQMVQEAQAQKSPTQRFTEAYERIFVPVVLGGVVLVIFGPPLLGWLTWSEGFLRGMTMLVAASPCALAIATPSAVLAGIAQAARNGVLIKGGMHLENLGALQAIAFDKTGTITRGRPEVVDLIPAADFQHQELLQTAASVESRSGHPLAEAVVRKAEEDGLPLINSGPLESVTGRGVRSQLNGEAVWIGNLRLFEESEHAVPDAITQTVDRLESSGRTTMVVKRGNRFLGTIGLADQPRENAKHIVGRLQGLGIRALIMLTGDNPRVAAAIAEEVGLTEYRAELLPEQKVEAVKELLEEHGQVAMVGDGVNDAPAMTASTVGIAMGASGTDVALETADVALMADDLAMLPFAVALSRHSRRVILQNVIISLGVIGFLVPAALFGLARIGMAIVFHEGSTLLVVVNALRLLRHRT